jgi:dTMP kinase
MRALCQKLLIHFLVINGIVRRKEDLQKLVSKIALKKSVLIAIEGIDGAGKTTQSLILLERFREKGYPVVRLHEPTEGKWGKKIKDLAKNGRHKVTAEDELSLFYQDRLEDVENHINPALKKKNIVIMDRYYFSSVAYQSARGLEPDYIEEKNEKIAPKPDILIILDLKPETALRRIREKRNGTPNHFERIRYLERVRQIFLERFSNRAYVRVINGDDARSEQVIANEIWESLAPIIKEAEET